MASQPAATAPAGALATTRPEIFLVVNPRSGNGATGRRWSALEATARGILDRFEVAHTRGPMDAADITRKALQEGYRTILAVGGDGTLNEVVNGFFAADGTPVAPGAAVGILPQGTGGDFRRSATVPLAWEAAVRHVQAAKPRPIDVGRVRFRTHAGGEGVRYFLNVASCGISGAVDAQVNNSSKWMGGKLSFMLASLRALLRHKDHRVRVKVDKGAHEEVSITALALGNGQYFGGGMRVAPHAVLDDGQLGGTIWTGYTLTEFVFLAGKLYSGKHVESPRTRTFQAMRVEVDSDERVLLDIDGEQPGILPAVFDVMPAAISLRA